MRSGFTAYFVLSPVNGSFATVIGGTPRSIHLDRCATAHLTPAPRRQDHTTSPYASCALVFCAIRVHRISPHVRDDRETSLIRRKTRGVKSLICPTATSRIFLREGLDRLLGDLPVGLICRTSLPDIVIASEAKQSIPPTGGDRMACFAEPVIGRAFARPVGSH